MSVTQGIVIAAGVRLAALVLCCCAGYVVARKKRKNKVNYDSDSWARRVFLLCSWLLLLVVMWVWCVLVVVSGGGIIGGRGSFRFCGINAELIRHNDPPPRPPVLLVLLKLVVLWVFFALSLLRVITPSRHDVFVFSIALSR